MRQVFQELSTGRTVLEQVPSPQAGAGTVEILTRATLISAGTERMLLEFGKASLLGKARSQPDKVKQVLDKIRSDGLLPTLETVFRRLEEPLPLGYCNAGVVTAVGAGVRNLRLGDRVASNGPHAEVVCVPENLCAKIPNEVTDEDAAFTVVGSIGLQGLRLAAPTLGEKFVVYGLGLIGLVTVQLLRANGCEVLGVDLQPERLRLGRKLGAATCDAAKSDPATVARTWAGGTGVDGVIVTASAKSDEIVHEAASMCRKRGRIVLVGVVGLSLRRADFYEKELSFQVSCSYGPGRYDETYERLGQDYPIGFVRWTAQRNFQAVLAAIREGRLRVGELISHRFPIGEAQQAYDRVGAAEGLGIVLQYSGEVETSRRAELTVPTSGRRLAGALTVGVLGAGNFAKMTLLPALSKAPCRLRYVCDLDGAAATHLGRKYGAEEAVTDYRLVLADGELEAVLIATGHSSHARLVQEALEAGKHVFVEKPLALDVDELARVVASVRRHPERQLMVGFNRRFSPHVIHMREMLRGRCEPLAMTMTVNAGAVPPEHWVHDPARGGGRVVGEACHFIDLMVHLAGARVRTVAGAMMGEGPAVREDKLSLTMSFEDGSLGTLNYFANGAKAYPKEQLEVFSDGRVLRLDNFRRVVSYGFRRFAGRRAFTQDKGHAAELVAFAGALKSGGASPIPLAELVNVTLTSFAAMTAARDQRIVNLPAAEAALEAAVAVLLAAPEQT